MNDFKLHPQLQSDTHFVKDLPLCRMLVINDQRFPWILLVPRRNDATEAYQLTGNDQQQLLIESNALCHAMEKLFKPDKLNVAAIGNVVPQLHIHHIARYQSDVAWPAPVWGFGQAQPYDYANAAKITERLGSAVNIA